MINIKMLVRIKLLLPAILFFVAFSASSQSQKAEAKATNNSHGISNAIWITYINKTNLFLEKVDQASFLNYIIFKNDGDFSDRRYFVKYVNATIKKDKEELIYKVGKGNITTVAQVNNYFSSIQPKYFDYYKEFIKHRVEIIETENLSKNTRKAPINVGSPSLNCGSPCTNPGFESGTGFWDYSSGTACGTSSTDPCNIVAGFSSTAHDLTTVGGYDATVGGTILPVVPPGGGNNAMELGDYTTTGGLASRASISFTVSAANANFTYRYAVVLQDPGSSHLDPERPYFRVKVRDAGGTVLTCGDYEVMAKPPMVGFSETSSGSGVWYRPWTTVFIPLSAFIGQCITVEFTVSDCSQGAHYGYAYIDGDCDPLQLVSSSPAVCGGNAVTLTAPLGGVLYNWTNLAGGTTGIVGPATGQTIQVNQAGTYQVAITMVTGASCITTLNITIGSNPLFPVAQFTNTTVCAGSATQFTDTSTPVGGVNVWSWDFNADGIPDATTQNPSYTFPAAGTYPVSLIVTWGTCTADTIINVTVNPITQPTITQVGPFCSYASSVTLAASVAGGTWSGTGITSAALGTFNPASATIGNNVITYSISGSCPTSATSTIVVNSAPISNAGTDVLICTGSTASLGTASSVGLTYAWLPTAGITSSTISNPTYNATNATAAPITTTYTVTTTNTATTCTSTDLVDATVNPIATANAGPAQTICAGTSATLAGSIGGSATSGTWGGGNGVYNPNNSTLNATYTPSATEEAAGSVTLTLISNDPAGPCPVASATVAITINPIATINAGSDQTICIGSTVTLAGSIGGSTTTGTWSGGAGTFAPNNTTATAVYTPTAAEESASGLTLTFTSDDPAGPCGIVSDIMVITINQLPTTNAGIDQTICAGTSATLSGIIGGTATGATWSGGTGTFTPNNTTLAASYLPSAAEIAAGTATLTITTNTPGLCPAATDQMIITINPIATINAGPNQTICIGSTVTLAGVLGGAATTGTWTGGAGTFAPNNTTATAVYTPTAAEESANGVTLTFTSDDPTGPCSFVSDQMVITINQLPTSNAGLTQSVCKGTSIHLSGQIGGSATSGTWTGGTGTYVPSNNSLNAVYTPSAAEYAAGTVTLTLTTNDPAGPCNSVSSTVTFNFYLNPVVNFTSDLRQGCPILCVQFADLSTMAGGDNIVAWDWNFGDGSPDSTSQNPSHCYSLSGYYTVTLTATSNHGCSTTFVINQMIHVFDVPVAEFNPTPNPATILESTVTLINQSSSDVNYWNWQFGDGDSISPNIVNPVHTYPNIVASTYTATLTVHNVDGCYATISHDIIIGPEFTFFIPNAFTPNGDGINDFFFGTGIGIAKYDLYIFDRWGNMIYHGDNIDTAKWDGKANHGSDQAQQDVYVWKVKLTDVFSKKHNYIGTVTLVK